MKLFEQQDRFHPCCGFSLTSVVPTVMPFVQIGFMKGALICLVIGVMHNWDAWNRDRLTNYTNYYIRLICWSGYLLHIITIDSLSFLLWKGCKEKRPSLIRVWLVLTPISVLFVVGMMGLNVITLRKTTAVSTSQIFVLAFGYAFLQCYLFYVVYYFMKDLEIEVFMSSGMRYLTDEEITEFEKGRTPFFSELDDKTKNLVDTIHYQRYKKEDFEIDENDLHYDKTSLLGSGEYGKVYKGVLQIGDENQHVAVKTIDSLDTLCFKALLVELKIMTYVGSHQHVVRFVGACTRTIRSRRLLIISELCELGNLQVYLRGCRGLFRNLVRDGVLQTRVVNDSYDQYFELESESISTLDLMRFSKEIASGMEYLSSMRVIHGDLASRNVLMTRDRVTKITDFGLARQLYSYSVYVKTQNTPLPWRWLSVEALSDMSYSVMSDVWAYAVTLYEIFTLGEVPYPAHIFCLDFLTDLKHGLRPTRPPNVPNQIWNLMESCWQTDPKSRPKFPEIFESLNSLQF